ncbi:MAG: RNA helicase, partial [Streptomyces sp.]|nr:RNA helicase [Streptomyces sp.]
MKHPDDSGIAHGGPAQPEARTPALPPAVSFAGLKLPVEVVRTLAGLGVREPFPIQAATLPDAL